jgi:glycosyltransferase involved in cell wall biosynthesis
MPFQPSMITVIHLITGLEVGGAERMLMQIACRSDRSRFRMVVVSMTGPGSMGPLIEASGVTVHSLGLRRGVPDPRGVVRLLRLLREYRPAVLQTWLYHADLLGLVAGRLDPKGQLLWNLRCTEMIGTAGLTRLLASCSAIPDGIIVNSEAGQRQHAALGYRPQRWIMIPNGFDTGLFRPDAEARRRGRLELMLPDDAIAILLPARYHPMKDHRTFLAAAALLAARRPGVQFALAGTGVGCENRALIDEAAALGLNGRVRFLGEQPDLSSLYPVFDIITLTSAFGEGFPNVLGEAMACGVPCVATDVGDAAAIVADCGAIVPPRDPEALAGGWERLIQLDPEERGALGLRARERIVEYYNLERVVGGFEAVYAETPGKKARKDCPAS